MAESEAATKLRRQHEIELERVGGAGTEAGQNLLDKWYREALQSRNRYGLGHPARSSLPTTPIRGRKGRTGDRESRTRPGGGR